MLRQEKLGIPGQEEKWTCPTLPFGSMEALNILDEATHMDEDGFSPSVY